jgi:hypothetical protein
MKKKQTRKKLAQPARASIRKGVKKAAGRIAQEKTSAPSQTKDQSTKKKEPLSGYTVQVKSVDKDPHTGNVLSTTFLPYIGAAKRPLTLEEAESHRDGLRRAGSGGRIISVPDGNVHEEWPSVAELETAQREEAASQGGAAASSS